MERAHWEKNMIRKSDDQVNTPGFFHLSSGMRHCSEVRVNASDKLIPIITFLFMVAKCLIAKYSLKGQERLHKGKSGKHLVLCPCSERHMEIQRRKT